MFKILGILCMDQTGRKRAMFHLCLEKHSLFSNCGFRIAEEKWESASFYAEHRIETVHKFQTKAIIIHHWFTLSLWILFCPTPSWWVSSLISPTGFTTLVHHEGIQVTEARQSERGLCPRGPDKVFAHRTLTVTLGTFAHAWCTITVKQTTTCRGQRSFRGCYSYETDHGHKWNIPREFATQLMPLVRTVAHPCGCKANRAIRTM